MKRSNRWIFEYRSEQILSAVDVRISPITRNPEVVREPDGSVTPLSGWFDLCTVEVEVLKEQDTSKFFEWLQEPNPEHDTLAVYCLDRFGGVLQTYEVEQVLPAGLMPGAFPRYEKNQFHRDGLRFVGVVRKVAPS